MAINNLELQINVITSHEAKRSDLEAFQDQLTGIATAAMQANEEMEMLTKQLAAVRQENMELKAKLYDIEHKGAGNG